MGSVLSLRAEFQIYVELSNHEYIRTDEKPFENEKFRITLPMTQNIETKDKLGCSEFTKYHTKVKDVINEAMTHLNKKYFPYSFALHSLSDFQFTKMRKWKVDPKKKHDNHAYVHNYWVQNHFVSLAADEQDVDWRMEYNLTEFNFDVSKGLSFHLIAVISGIQLKVHVICTSLKLKGIDGLKVSVEYVQTIQQVIYKAMQKIASLNEKDLLDVTDVYWTSMGNQFSLLHQKTLSLNDFSREVIKRGITLEIAPKREHKVAGKKITCEYMVESNEYNPSICPIFRSIREEYDYTEENLLHLKAYNHYKDEYAQKPDCRYAEKCYAYKRLEAGGNGFDDQIHMIMYKHPPRRRINLLSEEQALDLNQSYLDNHKLYKPTQDDYKLHDYDVNDGFIEALLEECVKNGFESDLYLPDDDSKSNYSIMKIVEKKMICHEHKALGSPLNKGEMLSMIMYTGCDSNYDLCKSQRLGLYDKWKWFDYCLWHAVDKLSKKESGQYKVYSGLNKVKLNKQYVATGYFRTYVSTSWVKDVSMEFMEEKGMIIEIDESFRKLNKCCNVSWISKFPDECEILIARSVGAVDNNKFQCKILDEHDGIQTVCLSNNLDDQ